MVQRFVVKVWLLRIGEFPHFQTFFHVLDTWSCSRTNKDLSLGELIYGVLYIIVYMFSNWFSSLYRVFLVLFESLQVWSCTGWEMDQLEQKKQKTVQFGDFYAAQSDDCFRSTGATLQTVPEQAEQPE